MRKIASGPPAPLGRQRRTRDGATFEVRPPLPRLADWRVTVDVDDEEHRPGYRLVTRTEARRPDVDAAVISEQGRITAIGLEEFETPADAASWLEDGLAVLTGVGASTRAGRPLRSGTFPAREAFMARLTEALAKVRGERGAHVTQARLADELGADERTLRRWLDEFGVRWHEIRR